MAIAKFLLKLLFLPIVMIWKATAPRHFPHGRPFNVTQPLVIDGDTFWVQNRRYRIWGIDAPELSQQGGVEAKHQLERLVNHRKLYFVPKDTDVYGRVVVQVFCGRGDIGEAMVQAGYAMSRQSCYKKAATISANKKNGLHRYGPLLDPAVHRRRMAS